MKRTSCVGLTLAAGLLFLGPLFIGAAEPDVYFQLDLNDADLRGRITRQGAQVVDEGPDGKPAIRIDVAPSDDPKKLNKFITLTGVVDLAPLANAKVKLTALARGQDISKPGHSFTGVKMILSADTTSESRVGLDLGGIFGTFDWKTILSQGTIPSGCTRGTLVLALQECSGTVWFTDIRIERVNPN